MSENRIEAIKARREEYEDVRYQNYSGDLTEDASVDFDYLLAELARLQAECAALKVIAEERAQEIYRMQQIMDSRPRHE